MKEKTLVRVFEEDKNRKTPDRLDKTNLPEEDKKNLRFAKSTLLEPNGLDDSIVEVSGDGNAVYDYSLIVEFFQIQNDWTWEETENWVDENIMNKIKMMPDPKPVVMMATLDDDEWCTAPS